jgi:AraC family transcriptional regulator, exoenzyme S synthesis regulatory protein ExsA
MLNLYENIYNNPHYFRQLSCGKSLIAEYNCPLENRMQDLWSEHNYIVCVVEGRKIWHTAHGSYDLQKGSCVFVRKGACIVEQFLDAVFCNVLFFLPDEFICDVLKTKSTPIHKPGKKYDPVIPIDKNETLDAFFQSMRSYFGSRKEPDQSLIELKFREIILTIADNPKNAEILSYFNSLLSHPQVIALEKVMEDNFCYNLKMDEFARLSNRSLSAFKRDFQKQFSTTPGKWLLEKRLQHAMNLLSNAGKAVSEASFESGFENPSHFSRAFRQHFGITPAMVKQPVTS